MVEEMGDHSVQGQMSWLSYGLKVQETQYAPKYTVHSFINSLERLAIRYQLWSQEPQLTIEDAQILENKQAHLQKAIDIFSHQSDTFLIHPKFCEDVPMVAMGGYLEYDHADDIDESGVPGHLDRAKSGHSPRTHPTEGSGMNAEDIPLILPSSLGWELCIR
jgi:hypothetical protein